MKNLDYSTMSVDELILLDKVDISQVIKYFKEDIINLNLIFFRFKGYHRKLIIGQWIVFVDYPTLSSAGMIIKDTKRISNHLANEYCYSPEDINKFIDDIKTERMTLRAGLHIEINDDFEVYDEDNSTFQHTLSGSCMNGCGDRYYNLRGCLTNPDDLKICTARDSKGNLVARSLIWKDAYFDRIYGNSDTIIHFVKRHLSSLGYESVYYSPCIDIDISVRECLGNYTMPYMDSLCYYREYKGTLSTLYTGSGTLTIQAVDGDSWYTRRRCACCGERINVDDDGYYISRSDEFVGTCCKEEVVFAVDTEEYEYIEECTQDYDTGNWFYDESELYYAVDADRYYVNTVNLYYAVDTCNLYEDSDDLYYAEDTGEWYETTDDLFYDEKREVYLKGDL